MIVAIIITCIVILDQASKFFAVKYLLGVGEVQFIPQILSLRYHENRGAAWGMFSEQRWIFMTISTIAIIAIILFFFVTRKQKQHPLLILSLAFFCGGGIGNMIDRVLLGYVIDFLNFEFIEFPIFNVADSFISIGACLMVLHLILETINDYRKKKNEAR